MLWLRKQGTAEKEMHFKALVLLHRIVCAHAEMKCDTFVARFAGETVETQTARMEYYLRLAMVQGITSQSKRHRRWEWNLFHSDQLLTPIPGFIDTYDFYDTFNQECPRNPDFNRLGSSWCLSLEKKERQNGSKSKSVPSFSYFFSFGSIHL
jgi:hypothetical protein